MTLAPQHALPRPAAAPRHTRFAPGSTPVYDRPPRRREDVHRAKAPAHRAIQETLPPVTDGLLQRVSRGEAPAVRECLDRYSGLVWSLARRFTFNDAEAEDAVQEVFVEVWKNAWKYDSAAA